MGGCTIRIKDEDLPSIIRKISYKHKEMCDLGLQDFDGLMIKKCKIKGFKYKIYIAYCHWHS
jgi:hypothetical protein